MAFRSVFKFFSKQDGLSTILQKADLYNQSPASLGLKDLVPLYDKLQVENKQQQLVKLLICQLEKRKSMVVKVRILVLLLDISKTSSYDIPELLIGKKLKLFCEESVKKKIGHTFELTNGNKEEYIHKYVLIPIHNYMIKLGMNEELYETCKTGQVPYDDLYRRGSKIRYVWVFKIYNMINLLLPLLDPLLRLLDKYPTEKMFEELLTRFYRQVEIYTNFVSKCIEQTLTQSNPLLLPYTDCLQFFESIKEYQLLKDKLDKHNPLLKRHLKEAFRPVIMVPIEEKTYKEIEMLAIRIQLISTSLRSNNPKENERLATEYNDRMESFELRMRTEGDEDYI